MCGDVSMFSSGHEWTPRDELYNIANQSIDLDLGLHEPIGIFELSTFDCLQHRLCRNPTLAKCGGEAQHLEKLEVGSLPGLPNV